MLCSLLDFSTNYILMVSLMLVIGYALFYTMDAILILQSGNNVLPLEPYTPISSGKLVLLQELRMATAFHLCFMGSSCACGLLCGCQGSIWVFLRDTCCVVFTIALN